MNQEPGEINNASFRSLTHISTIMSVLLIISVACSLLVRLKALEFTPSPRLEIYSPDLPHMEGGLSNLTVYQHANLVLTCEVISNEYIMAPNISFNSPRLTRSNVSTSVTLNIENVNDNDSGSYMCKTRVLGHRLHAQVNVRVVREPDHCSQKFSCLGSECIFTRFLCDGVKDCPNGEDESPQYANCSLDPCENKIRCGKRCIPTNWCCVAGQLDCNVTHIHSCCLKPGAGYGGEGYVSELRRRDDGFLETTIYIVIGCATAFMVLLIILMVAICRFHLKRISTPVGRQSTGRRRPPGSRPQAPGMGDFDDFLNQAFLDWSRSRQSGFRVTYNINNGVQIMGRPVDPPPYCEVVCLPPRGGPPPPYVPNENMMRLTNHDNEEPSISEGDALLGVSEESHCPTSETNLRPGREGDAYLPPPSASSRCHVSVPHSRVDTYESTPSGSEQRALDANNVEVPVFQPTLDGKCKQSTVPSRTVAVVADEASFKHICAASLPVDHQVDSKGK